MKMDKVNVSMRQRYGTLDYSQEYKYIYIQVVPSQEQSQPIIDRRSLPVDHCRSQSMLHSQQEVSIIDSSRSFQYNFCLNKSLTVYRIHQPRVPAQSQNLLCSSHFQFQSELEGSREPGGIPTKEPPYLYYPLEITAFFGTLDPFITQILFSFVGRIQCILLLLKQAERLAYALPTLTRSRLFTIHSTLPYQPVVSLGYELVPCLLHKYFITLPPV